MIFGLTGKLGSGKDAACLRLAALVSSPVERISFADKLKESCAALFNVTVEELDRMKNDPRAGVTLTGQNVFRDWTARELLQRYGTESHRDVFGDDFWVDAALPLAVDQYDFRTLYVVTDVRFPNELKRIQDLEGLVIRITGPNEDTGTHASEQVLEGVNWEIDNKIRDDNFAWLDSQLRAMLHWNGFGSIITETSSGLVEAA